ncbi:MAG: hypothetical protein ABI364_05020 [Caldimonas sp.]
MPLLFLSRWLDAATTRDDARSLATGRGGLETCPPPGFGGRRAWSARLGSWLGASAWGISRIETTPIFGKRAHNDALAAARLDFADALLDVRTSGAAEALDRIAITRSLHELWHFRAEVFSRVARQHDQAEASRRVSALDRHFSPRARHAPRRSRGSPAPAAAAR